MPLIAGFGMLIHTKSRRTIFYIVKTDCQWRMLPSSFAPWELVHYYYRKWSSLGEFDLLLNNL